MPIAIDGEVFENEVSYEISKIPELKRVYITGSEIEDRREEDHTNTFKKDGTFNWEGIPKAGRDIAVSVGNTLWGTPRIEEAPVSEMSRSLGHEDIDKVKGDIGRSPLEKGIDDIQDTLNIFGLAKGPNWSDKLFKTGLGASTEPADALKTEEGTQVPLSSETAVRPSNGLPEPIQEIRPEPYGLNPPVDDKGMDNPVQRYFKRIEDDIRSIPDIPKRFMEDMEKSRQKGKEFTTEDIDKTLEIVMNAGPGAIAGTLAGVKAATIKTKLSDLGHAQLLEASGVHADEIWKTTGFGRGADGRWRHEIDDSKASFDRKWADNPTPTEKQTGMKIKYLPEVLDHPELYKAYPKLKEAQIIYDNNYKGLAQWDGAAITVGKGAFNNQGIIMHEIQHAIQDIEGFAKGGSPVKDPVYLKHTPEFNKLKPEMEAMLEKVQKKENFTEKEWERALYLNEVAKKYKEYTEAAYREAWTYYSRLAGEVEARNVDTRLLLTEAERRRFPPHRSEDTVRRLQIPKDEPVATLAYGIFDEKTGKYVKPK